MIFSKLNKKWEFTKTLLDLLKNYRMTLTESLAFMESEILEDSVIRSAAEFLYRSLEKGTRFTLALRECEIIPFDELYILFIALAERTGNIIHTLEFLERRCLRKIEDRNQIFEACIYPVFVVFLAVSGVLFLLFWSGKNTVFIDFFSDGSSFDYSRILIRAFVFLFTYCGILFFFIGKLLGEDKLCEAFLAIDYLTGMGINLAEAIGAGIEITGIDSIYGKKFLKVKTNVENGMELKEAFSLFDRNIHRMMCFAKIYGNENKSFEKVIVNLNQKKERRRRICFSLIEPLFLLGTGGFLVILLWGIYGNGVFGWL